MNKNRDLRRRRQNKARSTRRKVLRRGDRPRLAVFRSSRYIYAQIIDDVQGKTLVSACSREKELATPPEGVTGKVGIAAAVGTALGQRAKEAGVEKAVFDRRHYKYHGRIKALADAARKAGLSF